MTHAPGPRDYQLLLLQKQFIGHNEAAVYFIWNSPDEFNFVVMQGNDKMQKNTIQVEAKTRRRESCSRGILTTHLGYCVSPLTNT